MADLLQRRRPHFSAALDRVAGRVELGVKVHVLPSALDDDAGSSDDSARPSSTSPGRDYLRRRRHETDRWADQQRRAGTMVQQIHSDLAGLAVAHELHRPQDPRLSRAPGENLLNAAYLVSETRIDTFVARARELDAAATGVTLAVTGPWVPYSFAHLDAEDAEEEP